MTVTRIGIVSDTHGEIDSRVLLALSGCAVVLHAGDVGGEHVLDALRQVTERLFSVPGNNDMHAASRQWPHSLDIPLPGGTITLIHGHQHGFGSPCHKTMRSHYAHARAIVYGHTHRMLIDDAQSPWILNPGAAGHTRTHGGPSCLLLDASARRWSVKQRRFDEVPSLAV